MAYVFTFHMFVTLQWQWQLHIAYIDHVFPLFIHLRFRFLRIALRTLHYYAN